MVSRDAYGLSARRSIGPPWPAGRSRLTETFRGVAFRRPARFDQLEHRNDSRSFALTVRLVYGGEANKQWSDE
jgi:hypothetical protein